jgi:hypothetical protein
MDALIAIIGTTILGFISPANTPPTPTPTVIELSVPYTQTNQSTGTNTNGAQNSAPNSTNK